jgi:hypothetical protein
MERGRPSADELGRKIEGVRAEVWSGSSWLTML